MNRQAQQIRGSPQLTVIYAAMHRRIKKRCIRQFHDKT